MVGFSLAQGCPGFSHPRYADTMETLVLKPREERRLRAGHLWVFANEVSGRPEATAAGELVEVLTAGGESLGSATYHPDSLIVARLLAGRVETLDRDFFLARIRSAAEWRQHYYPSDDCYRVIHGESDLLPGLVVDRFGAYLVVQTVSSAMEKLQPLIVDVLWDLFRPAGVIERNDSALRDYENLPRRKGVVRGDYGGPVEILEGGLRYRVDLLEGQKTGFFLDQKANRAAAAAWCRGRSVLDCFCNAGGFALRAAQGGAERVLGVDASGPTVKLATGNAALNGFSQVEFLESDVFRFLESVSGDPVFDVVILDPPSFSPRKKDVPKARKAYRRLNQLGIEALAPGGILVTASCSFHLREEVFYQIVGEAAVRAGRRLQLLERRQQAPDHPILPAMPETAYLKLGIFRVAH